MMGWLTRFFKAATATYSAVSRTAVALVITWTSNEPTASATQTIDNGTVPTVAELGQFAQNINTIATAMMVDFDALNAELVKLAADVELIREGINDGE